MIEIDLLRPRLAQAVEELTPLVQDAAINVEDEEAEAETRCWLNESGLPLDWVGPGITPDEFFFVTTLYGRMPPNSRRTHIRKFFPRFVQEAGRDIRNFTTELLANWQLRNPWMKDRLCQMAEVLRESQRTMEGYVAALREIERKATPDHPTPALDRIIRDHRQPSQFKTLSVFIRDCVKGNCFPIDSRVRKQLTKYELPVNERCLVRICLSMGQNPRRIARIFFSAPQMRQAASRRP